MGFAKELDFETTDLASFIRANDDGTADEGRGIWGGKNRGCGVTGQNIANYPWLAVIVVFVSNDDSNNLAKKVGGEFFGEFNRINKDSFVIFGEGEPRMF